MTDQTGPDSGSPATPGPSEAVLRECARALFDATGIRVLNNHNAPATAPKPADRAALRDRIAETLLARIKRATVSKQQPHDAVTSLLAATEYDLADAVLAVLPAPADRTTVLREAAAGFDRHAEQLLDGIGGKAVFVAKALRDQAAVWSEAAETLRRMAAEAEYVAIPCDSMVPCEDGGEPCHVHERLMAHAEGDHGLCGPECDKACTCASAGDAFVPLGHYRDCPAAAAEPHPTEADVRHALAVLDHFHGQDAEQPAAAQQPKEADGDRIVAYRMPVSNNLYCTVCCGTNDRATPLTSDDLPDGGLCAGCDVDVLIPQQPKEAGL